MGIHPSFIPASEDMTIIIKTIPLAPMSAEPGKNSQWTIPEISAVKKIAQNSGRLPYFSSSGGPTTRMNIMLLM